MPRKCALFHRLSILERATDHNNNCSRREYDFKCNGPTVFSQRGGRLKSLTCTCVIPPPSPPLTLPHSCLLSLVSPPPHPPPPLLLPRTMTPARLQGRSPTVMGDPSVMTVAMSYFFLMDQSHGKPLPERMSREVTSSDPTPSQSLRAPEVGTHRPGEGGGGAVIAWPSHVGPTYTLCELDC